MQRSDWEGVLGEGAPAALEYLGSLPTRTVYPRAGYPEVKAALDHPLTDDGVDPRQVVSELARDLNPYVTAHASGRFFGFVIGGSLPAALAADWLASA